MTQETNPRLSALVSRLDGTHHEDLLEALLRKHGDEMIVVDDGNAEAEYSALAYDEGEAAREYVDDGDWGDRSATTWVTVYVWRRWTIDGVKIDSDRGSRRVTIEPDVPECSESEHDWQSPEWLGGLKENPGVWGNGGGVIITEVCMHCSCKRVTDTWAQDMSDGTQGLTSIEYEPGAFADEVRAARLEAAADALRAAGYDLSGSSDEDRLILAVSDAGNGDPEATEELESIRAIVAAHRCEADWTGHSDTDADGDSTSDIRIDPA